MHKRRVANDSLYFSKEYEAIAVRMGGFEPSPCKVASDQRCVTHQRRSSGS